VILNQSSWSSVASQDCAKLDCLIIGMSGEGRLGRMFGVVNDGVARLSDVVLVAVGCC